MNAVRNALAVLAILFMSIATAFAGTEVNVTTTGLAMRGVDPVSYFKNGAPQAGDFKITAVHNGAVYRFATEKNKAAFVANPEKYLPQYGGYCAMGVKMGKKLDGDPAVWSLVDGKLYLNVAPAVKKMWRKDTAANISGADAQWIEIKGKEPGSL